MIKKLWKEIIDNSTLPRVTNKSSFYYMLEPRFLDFLLVHKFVYSTAANLYGCKGHWINRWIWWFHDFYFFHREQESDGHKGFPTPCVSFSTMCQACEMLDFPIDFNREIRGSMVPWLRHMIVFKILLLKYILNVLCDLVISVEKITPCVPCMSLLSLRSFPRCSQVFPL
jgi:hypothetical protein